MDLWSRRAAESRPGEKLQKQTLPEQIANQLRRKILLGELPPGSPVKERENAATLGVSRTPMREAIRILAKEGLVVLRPSRSPIVADPSLKEASDDLTVMGALEILSAELACKHATEQELAEIAEIYETLLETSQGGEQIDAFEVDMQFHRAIAIASHNPALAETHDAYLARLWRTRFLSATFKTDRIRSLSQHGEIVRGLQMRDADLVVREVRSHIEHIVVNITHLFEERAERERSATG
jgi:DNA-binding GntR family transcriptional regulator